MTDYREVKNLQEHLEKEYNVKEGKLADIAYRVAYENGHAYGNNEVANHYCDMLDLLEPAQENITLLRNALKTIVDIKTPTEEQLIAAKLILEKTEIAMKDK